MKRWWVAAWLVLAVTITAATLVAADHGRSAEDDLAAIRHFVEAHPSFQAVAIDHRGVELHFDQRTAESGRSIVGTGTGWVNIAPGAGVSSSGAMWTAGDLAALSRLGVVRDGPSRLVADYVQRDLLSKQVLQVVASTPDDLRSRLDEWFDTAVTVVVEHTGARLDAITTIEHEQRPVGPFDAVSEVRYRNWSS